MNLSAHYSRFRVTERLLLTGHSHQAWPDVAFEAQQQAWLDAARLVDDKWARAEEVADQVRAHWRRLLGDSNGDIALGQNTHELVTRLLSALLPMFRRSSHAIRSGGASVLPFTAAERSKLLTTDGEFHTIRRQLDRFAEEGLEVVKEPSRPVDSLAERLAARVDDHTACVLMSSVLFETAEIVPGLPLVAAACVRHGAELLIDAYHHLNVVPFEIAGLERAFITGGGYKYCQLGEGNGFLRVPPGCTLRPVLTGWFTEFGKIVSKGTKDTMGSKGALGDVGRGDEVPYGAGAARFAGATYDPTAHYRAAAVFDFHEATGLTPARLRAISQRQTRLLADNVVALNLDPSLAALIDVTPAARAGFVAIRSPRAGELVTTLRARGMYADSRGNILRLGPAPYLTDTQLTDAVGVLGSVLSEE
jgi:kynureninase